MILLILAILILLAHMYVFYSNYNSLPEKVPLHFNAVGMPDGWGSKNRMIFLPVLAVICFIITVFSAQSQNINVPEGWDHNELRKMIDHLIFSVQLVFLIVTYQSIQVALKKRSGIGGYYLLLMIFLVIYPFFFCFKAALN